MTQPDPRRIALEASLLFLAFFMPGYIAQAGLALRGPVTDFAMLQSIAAGIPQFFLMAWIAGALTRRGGADWGFAALGPRDLLWILLVTVTCFAAVTPFFLLVTVLPPSWSRALSLGYRWGLRGPGQLPLALLFSLTAGYREEFFFRAYLLRRFSQLSLAPAPGVAISTALFCAGHVYEGPLGVAIAAALGLVLAVAYLSRRNLHVVAIAHTLYNAVVLSLSLFAPRALSGVAGIRILLS